LQFSLGAGRRTVSRHRDHCWGFARETTYKNPSLGLCKCSGEIKLTPSARTTRRTQGEDRDYARTAQSPAKGSAEGESKLRENRKEASFRFKKRTRATGNRRWEQLRPTQTRMRRSVLGLIHKKNNENSNSNERNKNVQRGQAETK